MLSRDRVQAPPTTKLYSAREHPAPYLLNYRSGRMDPGEGSRGIRSSAEPHLEMFFDRAVWRNLPFLPHQDQLTGRCYCLSKTTSSVKGLPSLSVPDM